MYIYYGTTVADLLHELSCRNTTTTLEYYHNICLSAARETKDILQYRLSVFLLVSSAEKKKSNDLKI